MQRLKQQHDLAVLRLTLDRSEPRTSGPGRRPTGGTMSSSATTADTGQRSRAHAVFAFEAARRELVRSRVSLEHLGLPADLDGIRGYRYTDPPFVIPAPVLRELRPAIRAALGPDKPLWLELATPTGYLPTVPWERLLQPALNTPILRLPHVAIAPAVTVDVLDIVLCGSAPAAKGSYPVDQLLHSITRRLVEEASRWNKTIIHIFVDERVHGALKSLLGDLAAPAKWGQVRLYNPEDAVAYGSIGRSTTIAEQPGRLENPWLRWIADALAGRSADVVHFLGHGYLTLDQGAIALAESPVVNTDRELARFVGPQQLGAFLTRIGAWSIGFSSPPINFCPAGLRLLVDQLARLVPGPVFLHDLAADRDTGGLGGLAATYNFLYAPRHWTRKPVPPPSSPAVSVYGHPALLRQDEPARQYRILDDPFAWPADASMVERAKEDTPTWVAASERYLEQARAHTLEPASSSPTQRFASQGVERALAFLADVIRQDAPASRNDGAQERQR